MNEMSKIKGKLVHIPSIKAQGRGQRQKQGDVAFGNPKKKKEKGWVSGFGRVTEEEGMRRKGESERDGGVALSLRGTFSEVSRGGGGVEEQQRADFSRWWNSMRFAKRRENPGRLLL